MKKTTTTFTAKRIAIAVAAVCASLSLPAVANDNKAMLDLMLKKGVISQKDYDEFMEANKEADENKAFKDSRIDKDVSTSIKDIQKRQNDGSVKENGFGFKSKDGNSELNITGRLHFDARMTGGDWGEYSDRDSGSLSDRFSVRRARIGATGIFNKNINYEIVTNLVGSNANLLDTAWANYTVSPETQFRIGRFKQPYGLETLQSSNNIGYMERSYQDQLAPGKQLGAMFHGELPNSLTYAASVYQTGFDQLSSNGGFEFAARSTINFSKVMAGLGDDTIFHLGLAGTSGTFQVVPTTSSQSGNAVETKGAFVAFNDEFGGLRNVYRNRIHGTSPCVSSGSNVQCSATTTTTTTAAQLAAANIAPVGGSSLGTLTSTSTSTYNVISAPAQDTSKVQQWRAGLEAVAAKGPWKLQAEYTYADLDVTGKASKAGTGTAATSYDAAASGKVKVYYIDLMYNITGENWAPTYRSGVVGAVRPNSPFDLTTMSGTGAWQIGLRYSRYDASSFGGNNNGDGKTYTNTAGKQYEVEGSPIGTTMTLGLNWILNPNARVMFNYSQSRFDSAFYPVDIGTSAIAKKIGDNSHAFMLRSQFNF